MTDRLGALDALCREAGVEPAERDTLNAALGVLTRRGISGHLWLAGRTWGTGMGFTEIGADDVLQDRDRGLPPASPLVLVDLPVLDLADRAARKSPTIVVMLEESAMAAAALPLNDAPASAATYARALQTKPLRDALLSDAEAPDAAHLAQEGYDEVLDCQCPLHVAARERML